MYVVCIYISYMNNKVVHLLFSLRFFLTFKEVMDIISNSRCVCVMLSLAGVYFKNHLSLNECEFTISRHPMCPVLGISHVMTILVCNCERLEMENVMTIDIQNNLS